MWYPEISPHALASLLAIAEHGSLSAAARARNLTQPSISRQIQDMENRLDSQLVERSNQGATLTPAGECLADAARDLLSRLAALPELVKQRQGEVNGRVRVGTTEGISIYVLPDILKTFIDANPHVDVQVISQPSHQLMSMLLADELDVAVGTTEHPKLTCERLYQDRLVLCYRENTPSEELPTDLASLAAAKVVTFPKGMTIRNLLDQAFEKEHLDFHPVMELANVEAIKAMVRSGIGLGIVPAGYIDGNGLAAQSIGDLKVSRTVRLMYRSQYNSLATEKMIEAILQLRQL